jgi:ubiquinone biosynthesis protein
VRLLLEHELDFRREQATLREARRTYRASFGIRIPRPVPELCTATITAMTAEDGVKVTEAFRRSPIRRDRIASQLIEALVAVPLFSRERQAVFHGDPHAGNLLYDEPNRELVVLDWALADHLTLHARRYLVMLALMMLLRNPPGVAEAIHGLSRRDQGGHRASKRLIEPLVNQFFERLPEHYAPGVLDAMSLLDQIALKGVRFPAALFLFRKSLFTLDGVLDDVAGPDVRMDRVITNLFLARWAASLGFFHAPLQWKDFGAVGWQALRRSAGCAPAP